MQVALIIKFNVYILLTYVPEIIALWKQYLSRLWHHNDFMKAWETVIYSTCHLDLYKKILNSMITTLA